MSFTCLMKKPGKSKSKNELKIQEESLTGENYFVCPLEGGQTKTVILIADYYST
jgi:hypothetical protein